MKHRGRGAKSVVYDLLVLKLQFVENVLRCLQSAAESRRGDKNFIERPDSVRTQLYGHLP